LVLVRSDLIMKKARAFWGNDLHGRTWLRIRVCQKTLNFGQRFRPRVVERGVVAYTMSRP